MLGAYDPAVYASPAPVVHPDSIARGIHSRVSPDSLRAYLEVLRGFRNRNTGADTLSATTGMGAARRWVYSKFESFSAAGAGRLIPSYLQFDQAICGQAQHRNIFAVLPGSDTSAKGVVVLEAHIDSRCEGLCNTACLAEGMEDNGSGTALVLELARVMSRYTFRHTVVFLVTIGEEQGLAGAAAFAEYCVQRGIPVKAVLNNDVIGGIVCGSTSSAPSCPGEGHIDSTGLRLFSFGGFNSGHKGLARYIKLQYKEMVRSYTAVPMDIRLMTPEDRTGRGGDHIPFRQKGFQAAVRFTSANEHGNADVASSAYTDRQHTSADVLGSDVNGDGLIDSFFVDVRYLGRNAVINGAAAAMAAIGPPAPSFLLFSTSPGSINGTITTPSGTGLYRVGLRSTTFDWDTVHTVPGGTAFSVPVAGGTYIVSIAGMDADGVESLFSEEGTVAVPAGIGEVSVDAKPHVIQLLQNHPNPFDEATAIGIVVAEGLGGKPAVVVITDLSGKEISRMPVELKAGMNEVVYNHGYGVSGTFIYTLVVEGKAVQSRRMVFAN